MAATTPSRSLLRLAAILCAAASFPAGPLSPAEAQTFLEIADSARDRVVPRPSPHKVPEFIHIAEIANKNKQTSPRPPGSVPEFVLIAESVHNSAGGGGHRPSGGGGHRPSGGGGHRPSAPLVQATTASSEISPLPTVSIVDPDPSNWGGFTQPSHENESTTEPWPVVEVTTLDPNDPNNGEEFEEDKIYFEEWEKDMVDPRK